VPTTARLLKCPSCGAPLALEPGVATIKCKYCGSFVTVEMPRSPTSTTAVIERRRHRRQHRHRIRHLIETLTNGEKVDSD